MTTPQLGSEPAYLCDGPNCVAYGMTKREFIATMVIGAWTTEKPDDCAAIAVQYADALLAELQK